MSYTNQQELNNSIVNYQNQKANCEAELAKVSQDLAVANNQLQQIEQQATQLFGTSDINVLTTQMQNLVIESQTLEKELNLLSNEQ